jgi:hypothetical protein
VQTKLSAVITIRAESLNIHGSIPASRMWWSKAAEVRHATILMGKVASLLLFSMPPSPIGLSNDRLHHLWISWKNMNWIGL